MIDFGLDPELELCAIPRGASRSSDCARTIATSRRRAASTSPRAAPSPRSDSPRSSGPRRSAARGSARSRARSCSKSCRGRRRAPRSRSILSARRSTRSPSAARRRRCSVAQPLLERPGARAILSPGTARAVALRDGRARACCRGSRPTAWTCWCCSTRDAVAVIDEGIALAPLRGAGLRAAGAAELRLDGRTGARMVV